MLAKNCMFSWFMEWHTSHIQGVNKTYLNTVYQHANVVTLDEVGSIMTACGGGGSTNPTPTVSLSFPLSSVCLGTSVTLSATANISSGSVSKVDFYDGTTLLTSDNSSPYTYTWTNATAGTKNLSAVATSAANVASSPANATLTVNALPVVDPFMQIDGVNWLAQGTAQVCEGTTVLVGPHPVSTTGWAWTGPSSYTANVREISLATIKLAQGGTYVASYTDANGCKNSTNVTVTVNANPVVVITSPANNSTVSSNPSNITINANITGTGISNVQFYNGTALLGQDATAPYSFAWNNVANGNYSLNVKATTASNCTATATSAVVVSKVTSVSDNLESLGLECFPNPFHESFTIKSQGDFSYVIYNAAGLEVENGQGSEELVTGKNLHRGVYMVKISSAKGNAFVKISK
jgi:hypothetical protein